MKLYLLSLEKAMYIEKYIKKRRFYQLVTIVALRKGCYSKPIRNQALD